MSDESIQIYVDIVLKLVDQLMLWQPQSHCNDNHNANWCPYELGGIGIFLYPVEKQLVIFSPIHDDFAMKYGDNSDDQETLRRFFNDIDHFFYIGEILGNMRALYTTIDMTSLTEQGGIKLKKSLYSAIVEKYSLSPAKDGSCHSESGIVFLLNGIKPNSSSGGCYIATAVYGSYDCPQVWILRRFRDFKLANSTGGRLFIRLYYAVSPTLVRWFGKTAWFNRLWRRRLDKMVERLHENGYADTPYND